MIYTNIELKYEQEIVVLCCKGYSISIQLPKLFPLRPYLGYFQKALINPEIHNM